MLFICTKKQTTFYDLCFIKCGLPVSCVLFIEPGNNIQRPIWCVHTSVHLDWFQSSRGDRVTEEPLIQHGTQHDWTMLQIVL